MNTKICIKCKIEKDINYFGVDNSRREDVEFLISEGHLPSKDKLIYEHSRMNRPRLNWGDVRMETIELLMQNQDERNDALVKGIKLGLNRYKFAVKCLGEPCRVADLGTGMGYGTEMMQKAGHETVGFDYSQEAIDYARRDHPGEYVVTNFNDLDPKLGGFDSFDAATCMETLCHLKNPKEFISKLMVKRLIISAPIDPPKDDGYIWRLHSLSEDEFKGMFEGWEIIDEYRQSHYLALYLKKI